MELFRETRSEYLLNEVGSENMSQSNIRLKSFDALKLFTIFFVLWGHSVQYFISGEYVDKPLYIYIYSFHMPLFMMVSGYFSLSSMYLSPVVFMKKKTVQLLLPWLTWGVIMVGGTFVYRFLHGYMMSFTEMVFMMVHNFWFLKSLFLCYLIAYWGKWFISNVYLEVLVTMILVQLVHYYNLPIMYPCFLIGMYLKSKDSQWQKHSLVLFILSLSVFLSLLLFWNKSFWDYIVFNFSSVFIKKDHYPIIYLYREVYRIFIGIVGSLSFIFLFYLLFERERQSKILELCSKWGRYTLGIYVLQTIIL